MEYEHGNDQKTDPLELAVEKAERDALADLQQLLSPLVASGIDVEQILDRITRLVAARTARQMTAMVDALSQTLGSSILDHVYGENEEMTVRSIRIQDWRVSQSGAVWLLPLIPCTVQFAGTRSIDFVFDPKIEGTVAWDELQESRSSAPTIRIGNHDFHKFSALAAMVEDDAGAKSTQILVQMLTTPRGTDMRLEFTILWRRADKPTADVRGQHGSP
jgi:hypothetical protein